MGDMWRSIFLILAGVFVGAFTTLLVLSTFPDWLPRSGNLMGPVAVISSESMRHGYLGITFSNEPGRSLFVVDAPSAIAGDAAHIAVGDRVTSINGQAVGKKEDVQLILLPSKPGDVVEVGLERDQKPTTIRMRLRSAAEMYADLRAMEN